MDCIKYMVQFVFFVYICFMFKCIFVFFALSFYPDLKSKQSLFFMLFTNFLFYFHNYVFTYIHIYYILHNYVFTYIHVFTLTYSRVGIYVNRYKLKKHYLFCKLVRNAVHANLITFNSDNSCHLIPPFCCLAI